MQLIIHQYNIRIMCVFVCVKLYMNINSFYITEIKINNIQTICRKLIIDTNKSILKIDNDV